MGLGASLIAGRLAVAGLLAGTWAAASAAEQTAAQTMDEVLVTAARTEQLLADTLPSATVITRRDIEASQTFGLIELLGRQAGVEVARTGGPGAAGVSLFLVAKPDALLRSAPLVNNGTLDKYTGRAPLGATPARKKAAHPLRPRG